MSATKSPLKCNKASLNVHVATWWHKALFFPFSAPPWSKATHPRFKQLSSSLLCVFVMEKTCVLPEWQPFCWMWYWGKAWKSCWGQTRSASVSLISPGRRNGRTRRQAAPCLRIILSDVLKTKRADLQISASHWNDPEMTQWTVSSARHAGRRGPAVVGGCAGCKGNPFKTGPF